MKKCLIYSLFIALALVSCKGGKGDSVAPEEEVAERVNAIYGEVFGLYTRVDEEEDHDYDVLIDSVPTFYERFMGREYRELQRKVQEIDSLYYPEEIGFFEYDSWVQGQDWHELAYRVDSVWMRGKDSATALLRITNCGSTQTVELPMVREAGEWRIEDFVTFWPERNSELQAMREYVDIEHEEDTD